MAREQTKIDGSRISKATDGLPQHWKIVKLLELGTFKNGINKEKDDFGHGIPFINLMDVFGKPAISGDNFDLVNASSGEIKNYSLKSGDILFVRSSVIPSGVGLTTLVEKDLKNTVFSGFLIRFRTDGKLLDLGFKKYCFHETNFRRSLIRRSSVSANTNINQEALETLSIAVPPRSEQRKIALILSTWDRAIERTEQLIAQKQRLKKGLMQQLLTGRVRFKEFVKSRRIGGSSGRGIPVEWTSGKLGNSINLISGQHLENSDYHNVAGDGVPYFTGPTDFANSIDDVKKWTHKITKVAKSGNILVTVKGSGVGQIHKLSIGSSVAIGRQLMAISGKRTDNDFLYFILLEKADQLEILSRGNMIPGVTRDDILTLKVSLPPLQEQRKIGRLLMSTDSEISLLMLKLQKISIQKKGLMQQLLTGKVRVKI